LGLAVSERAFLPTPCIGRRHFLLAGASLLAAPARAADQPTRRFQVAFANLTEEPGVRLEGLGFFGTDVRRSFELAVRTLPLDITYFDNGGDSAKALANADTAIAQRVDLLIEYNSDLGANLEISRKMKAAGIPVLAVNYSVPGAQLYTADNFNAGRIAGRALGQFAKRDWKDDPVVAVVAGDLGDLGIPVTERVRGIIEGLHQELPDVKPTSIDTSGNPVRIEALLKKFLATMSKQKILIATLDDATALAAKGAVELLLRNSDCVICGQGMDRTLHGGSNEKKEIDPTNRNSPIIGSVAYFLDRYGYDVLPLVLKILRGEPVAPRTTTKHILVSAQNVFAIYPPYDMN
jgi:ribose transport system substrate-binding protein